MGIPATRIKRSIRDFSNAARDLMNAEFEVYQTRVKRLVRIIEEDEIIKQIVTPLLTRPIEIHDVIQEQPDDWTELALPSEIEDQITFVLKLFQAAHRGELDLPSLAVQIFRESQFNQALYRLNQQIVDPALRELLCKLEDLVADKVEGRTEVPAGSLQILNYGTISSEGGPIAMGGSHISTQDRRVTVGRDLTGVLQSGDNSSATFHQTQLPSAAEVDIIAEFRSLRSLIEALGSPEQKKMERALEDAEDELTKESPDREEVGSALERVIQYAKKAEGFTRSIDSLRPHVNRIGAWLGTNWHRLLAAVNTIG